MTCCANPLSRRTDHIFETASQARHFQLEPDEVYIKLIFQEKSLQSISVGHSQATGNMRAQTSENRRPLTIPLFSYGTTVSIINYWSGYHSNFSNRVLEVLNVWPQHNEYDARFHFNKLISRLLGAQQHFKTTPSGIHPGLPEIYLPNQRSISPCSVTGRETTKTVGNY